jgi:hypothetical protein
MTRGYPSAARLERYIAVADALAFLLAVVALADLSVRAMRRFDPGWDGLWYHLPFAARRGGLPVPYEMSAQIRDRYAGFPPLPEAVQGILWRVTGSINATGLANYLGLVLFLYFCHRKLGARFWIVAIVSLTAPLVLIHTTIGYVDLFSNALLAIGTSSIVAMYLFDWFDDRALLLWGLLGFAGAAWSKYQIVPIIAVFLIYLLVIYGVRRAQPKHRRLFLIAVIGALMASAPYVKNLIVYHNPVWPVRMPAIGQFFPYSEDVRWVALKERPPPLKDVSQFKLFFHSLLEINHPTHYSYRERWTMDQGRAWMAQRMGGFWNVGVVTAIVAIGVLGVLWDRRKGVILLGSTGAFLCFVAVLPQSNELRFYLFLPLTWAATIGMLLPRIRRRYPAVALTVLSVLVAEFVYVSRINRSYYSTSRIGYLDVARIWGIPQWWATLDRSKVYCAVGFVPRTVMLTGPTMSEFHIIEGTDARDCPADAIFLKAR